MVQAVGCGIAGARLGARSDDDRAPCGAPSDTDAPEVRSLLPNSETEMTAMQVVMDYERS